MFENRLTLRVGVLLAMAGALLLVPGMTVAQTATRPAPSGPAVPTTSPASNIKISDAGVIPSLHTQGQDIRLVLQMLSTQGKTNIIASKDVTGTVTVDLYDVSFTEALDAVVSSAGYTWVRKGNFIYVMTPAQRKDLTVAERQMEVKVFKFNYMAAADAKALLASAMSADGVISMTPAAATGIETSPDKTGGNALATEDVIVVRDYPENIEKVTQMVKELDVRPQQVLIEATIMRASLDEANALGIDFNALAGIDFRSAGGVSTGGQDMTLGALPGSQLDQATGAVATDFRSVVPKGGLSIGFIYNNFAFFLRALESVTDVVVMANPKLLVMNKQRGEIHVGNEDGYITTTFTETKATQTVEMFVTGTRLIVRPYVGADGFVRMEIHPEDSTGGITATGLPSKQTTEVTSNVLVRDGHTIVIGGMFRERTSNGRSQVPFLGNLPVAGNLFRARSEATKREEVIILITPHIIKHAQDEAVSARLKDDVERIRVGLRDGLMWFGRDRLSQTHMRWAREHLAKGDTKRALWDVNYALSLQPRMMEAMSLKERLTKQAIWANEARVSSAGYILEQMIMQDLGLPFQPVVPPQKPMDPELIDPRVREAMGIGPKYWEPLPGPTKKRAPMTLPGAVQVNTDYEDK